jgi:ubiquinone/menaquinone biosynthesis C-methylase UbiE
MSGSNKRKNSSGSKSTGRKGGNKVSEVDSVSIDEDAGDDFCGSCTAPPNYAKLESRDAAASKKGDKKSQQIKEKYASSEYWDKRYESKEFHEWYYSYDDLKPILDGVLTSTSSVLEIGCGDAPLLTGMCQSGHEGELHCIDFSPTIITALMQKQKTEPSSVSVEVDTKKQNKRAKVEKGSSAEGTDVPSKERLVNFAEMDARNLKFPSNSFDCVIDKGTCDAMFCDPKNGKKLVTKIMAEAVRVMKETIPSVFILVSHIEVESPEFDSAFDEVIIPVLQAKTSVQWNIVAHVASASATVYMIQSTPRRFTRSLTEGSTYPVKMKVLSYDDDDDNDDDADDDDGSEDDR